MRRLSEDNTKRKMNFITLLEKNDQFIKKMNENEDSALKESKENIDPQTPR
jgi:hypothetical protein